MLEETNAEYPLEDFLRDLHEVHNSLNINVTDITSKKTVSDNTLHAKITYIYEPGDKEYMHNQFKYFQKKYGELHNFYGRLIRFDAICEFIDTYREALNKKGWVIRKRINKDFLRFLLKYKLDDKGKIPDTALEEFIKPDQEKKRK